MYSLHGRPTSLCDGINRREWLRIGGLGALSLPMLLEAQSRAADSRAQGVTFGKAKNVLFLWLQGGPPQHETFDPKPDAPAEIRGEFKPIRTNVPGIHFCELLPRIAQIADRIAVVRSLCTHTDLHDASGYWVLTGYKYVGTQSRVISPTDWPYLGSIVKMLKPSKSLPSYTSVWLPDVMRLNDNVQPAGQTGGFLGKRWDPERIVGDPSSPEFHIEGLTLPAEVPALRLSDRHSLLSQVERHFDRVERSGGLEDHDRRVQEAFGVLTSGKAREAFDLSKEPRQLRERYGLGKWGQSVLLGRRLIEAGARLVHVNWPRESGDSAVDNPLWDTHAQNADRLQDVLCPQLDVTFSTLIEDMEQRGLLSETLVVLIGEFGRTPKINANAGRDHWGHVFSFALAGAGISGGQVYGSSDKLGAYPATGKMEPQDLTATIFHLLGIGHDAFFPHPTGRPIKVTEGEPIWPLLGTKPATTERVKSEGNVAFVPPFSEDMILNTGFEDATPLQAIGASKRTKGWQATPLSPDGFGVSLVKSDKGQYAVIRASGKVERGAKAILAQTVRTNRAGKYTFTVQAGGSGAGKLFLKQFACRLVIYGYADNDKSPLKVREYASVPFKPVFADGKWEKVEVSAVLRSQDEGAYQLSKGIGAAVIVENTGGDVTFPAGQSAVVWIDETALEFVPRPRNDDVQV